MEQALYGLPGGFYQRRTPGADFYTAPELHPFFGEALGREAAARLERLSGPGPFYVIEAGCGDGTLMEAVVRGLREARKDLSGLRFVLIERSDKARAAALARLAGLGLDVTAYAGLAELPSVRGVLYANELLDALPFHLLEKREGAVLELCVDEQGQPAYEEPLLPELREAAGLVGERLAEGERHAVALESRRWLAEAASKLEAGAMVFIDYGRKYRPGVPVAVKTYRTHQLGSDPLLSPGETDITAPVDFEALFQVAITLGLAERYESLSTFLIARGFMEALQKTGEGVEGWKERNKLKTLVHPEGMGESFKVWTVTKD